MSKLRNLRKGWALVLALVLTVTFAGPSFAVTGDDGGGGGEVATTEDTAKTGEAQPAEEESKVSEKKPAQPAPKETGSTQTIGDYQCDTLTVDVTTTPILTPYVWSDDDGIWVLSTDESSFLDGDRVTTSEKMTPDQIANSDCSKPEEEAAVEPQARIADESGSNSTTPPEDEVVTQWVVWTIPNGCKADADLNMGFANADNSKGWSNCNTADKAFPQTDPQVMTEKEVKKLVPACGTWYQVDKYRGTEAEIAAVLKDGQLTYSGSAVEDSELVQEWFYLQGKDCEPEIFKIRICHATASDTQPYANDNHWVSYNSIDNEVNIDWNGHGDHEGDIIPPFADFPGKNWDPEHEAIYNNGCDVPRAQVSPEGPIIVDKCGVEEDTLTFADTTGVEYSIVTEGDQEFVKATITAKHTDWKTPLPDGWTLGQDGSAYMTAPKFTDNDPCEEVVCWIMPVDEAPQGGAVAAWFPQQRVDCDDPIPCGKWVQKDWYNTSTLKAREVYESLGNELKWINGKPADSSIYKSHKFIYGGDCEVTPEPPVIVDKCGVEDDSYTMANTEGVEYSTFQYKGKTYISAKITAKNTVWSSPLPEGWSKGKNNTLFMKAPKFTNNDPCVEVVCWLMPVDKAPHGGAVPAWFPQQRVDCDDPIPCGKWVQKDWYNTSTPGNREKFESLGETLDWVGGYGKRHGHPEDSSIYLSHKFIYGGDCAVPELTGTVVAQCVEGYPVLNYTIELNDPDHQTTPGTEATIKMTDGNGNEWSTPVPFDPGMNSPFMTDGSVPWPGAEDGAWPGWEQDEDGVWHETTGNFAWTRDGTMTVEVSYNPDFTTSVTYPNEIKPCDPPEVPICTADWTMGSVTAAEFATGEYTEYDAETCVPPTYEVCSMDEDSQTWVMDTVTEDQLTEDTRFWDAESEDGNCADPQEPETEVDAVLGAPPLPEAPSATEVVAVATFAG